MRWSNTKMSKKKTTVTNQLVIEKGQISVTKNNSTLLNERTTPQKFSFIPTGFFLKLYYMYTQNGHKRLLIKNVISGMELVKESKENLIKR